MEPAISVPGPLTPLPHGWPGGLVAAILAAALFAACGGGKGAGGAAVALPPETDPKLTAEDFVPRAVLVSAELTTAVDEERYLATAPTSKEFAPREPRIYLVGKLKNVPTDARIEVRWFRDADPKAMLVSRVHGSDTFSFVASLAPLGKVFIAGPYSARIFVDAREVGGASFAITGTPPSQGGPRVEKLAVSTSVRGKMRPSKPGTEFKAGTKRLFVTFDVAAAAPGSSATVRWLRNGETFHEESLEVAAEGRFGAELAAPDGLPDGSYSAAIALDGAEVVEAPFTVGDPGSGPRVDRLELGRSLGADNLPESAVTTFSTTDDAVRCGLRFLDLPPGAEITVEWVAVDEAGATTVLHTTRSALPAGGSGTMGAEWRQPDGGFERGTYRAVVSASAEKLAEIGFTIE